MKQERNVFDSLGKVALVMEGDSDLSQDFRDTLVELERMWPNLTLMIKEEQHQKYPASVLRVSSLL